MRHRTRNSLAIMAGLGLTSLATSLPANASAHADAAVQPASTAVLQPATFEAALARQVPAVRWSSGRWQSKNSKAATLLVRTHIPGVACQTYIRRNAGKWRPRQAVEGISRARIELMNMRSGETAHFRAKAECADAVERSRSYRVTRAVATSKVRRLNRHTAGSKEFIESLEAHGSGDLLAVSSANLPLKSGRLLHTLPELQEAGAEAHFTDLPGSAEVDWSRRDESDMFVFDTPASASDKSAATTPAIWSIFVTVAPQ